MLSRRFGAGALAAAVVLGGLGPASAQETLRALSMLPKPVAYTQSFLKFIDKVNAAGQGVVQIEFVGGPEAIPTFDQPEAVRAGVIDMIYGPASYYPGIVPETDALVGSNVTPMEKRENGGIDLLNQIHQEKMNVYYLGHPDGGIQFHVYMTAVPQPKDDGLPDMSGIKLRGAPIYREFFTDYLGATFVQVNVPEVYTALERGTVDGLGWPSIGVMDREDLSSSPAQEVQRELQELGRRPCATSGTSSKPSPKTWAARAQRRADDHRHLLRCVLGSRRGRRVIRRTAGKSAWGSPPTSWFSPLGRCRCRKP
jgi:TRAP-type mannitol/chloroaromatic compound transport system substrate-binding protein